MTITAYDLNDQICVLYFVGRCNCPMCARDAKKEDDMSKSKGKGRKGGKGC